MSYFDHLKTRNDWDNYFPKVSRARAIQRVVGATVLFGLVMLLCTLLVKVLIAYDGEYQSQQLPGTVWYVLFPTLSAIGFLTIAGAQTANAFSHAPSATREDRDALAAVLWVTARWMVRLAVAFGILLPALLILLPALDLPVLHHP